MPGSAAAAADVRDRDNVRYVVTVKPGRWYMSEEAAGRADMLRRKTRQNPVDKIMYFAYSNSRTCWIKQGRAAPI